MGRNSKAPTPLLHRGGGLNKKNLLGDVPTRFGKWGETAPTKALAKQIFVGTQGNFDKKCGIWEKEGVEIPPTINSESIFGGGTIQRRGGTMNMMCSMLCSPHDVVDGLFLLTWTESLSPAIWLTQKPEKTCPSKTDRRKRCSPKKANALLAINAGARRTQRTMG